MKEILENNLEIAYKEFKDYEAYFKGVAPQIKNSREEFTKFSMENHSNTDLLMEKLFENQVIPEYYRLDLINLQNRLIYTYEAVKDVIEIPEEKKKEIEALVRPKQVYTIQAGEAIETDKTHAENLKTEAKKFYKNLVEEIQRNYGS